MAHLTYPLEKGLLVYYWFDAMHTRIDMMLCTDKSEKDILSIADTIEKETSRIEKMGSCFLSDSEVSRINKTRTGEWVSISEELCRILEDCIRHAQESGGFFDIMVSKEKPGISLNQKLEVDQQALKVRRKTDGCKIDLSGYLKGYALQKAVDFLRKEKIRNALLSFGNSSIFAIGDHPKGNGWPVSYEEGGIPFILHDECLTTSGNNRETRQHIVNPRTGELITGKRKVSVITSSAEEGEVESTVKFITTNS